MRTTGRILPAALGLLLFAGIPHAGPKTSHADPGHGHHGAGGGGECGCPGGMRPPGMHDNTMPGGMPMHRRGGHMMEHAKEMRETVEKLRALEVKMESLKTKDDAAAFRAASLEHAKLLTDLQENHLKRMEEMHK